MRNLVPIGRFAALCRVTHKTLRHYDELDRIKPARIDAKSGYRYYDLGQLEDRLAGANAMLGRLHELLEQSRFSPVRVETKNVPEQSVLIIRTRSSLTGIGNVIHDALAKLYEYVDEVGVSPAGPPLTLYFDEGVSEMKSRCKGV